jgi:hypothetical protein
MTRKRQHKRTRRKAQTSGARRRITVRAEHREPVDLDRFIAVLVTLALRRVEEEADQAEADRG